MHAELLVEIALTRSGTVPADLIVRAYAASRFEPIALVLNGIDARLVDTVLDPVVPTMPLDIPGVLYVDIGSGRMWEMLHSARLVFASTPALRSAATASGVSRSRIRSAETAFLIPAEIKSPAEIPHPMHAEQIAPAISYEIVLRRLSLLRRGTPIAAPTPRIGR